VRFFHQVITLAVAGLLAGLLAQPPLDALAHEPVEADTSLAATVTLKAASPTVVGCAAVRVEIWVNDVANLYAADVHVLFDPALLQVVDADAAAPGTQIEPVYSFLNPGFIIKRVACNAADPGNPDCPVGGKVWYSATQLNPTLPANGSGPIAAFTLVGRAEGLSTLDISYQKLSSPTGQEVPASEVDSSIAVAPPAPPQVTITKVGSTTARLAWPAVLGTAEYRIYRASLPYFAPAEPPYHTTAALFYDDTGALGSDAVEYYYFVKAACSSGFTSPVSIHTGAFDFALVRGS